MKLKVYDMVINENDETGVDINSFVDAPAHMRSFEVYDRKGNKVLFQIDEDKRIVTGVFILADFLIYRNDRQLGEHYVKFTPEVIWQIRNKFFRNGFNNNTNVEHAAMVKGATLVDSYIVHSTDPRFPKVPEILSKQKVTDGSWVGSYYVENEKLWQDCKNGIFKGFSVEGYFDKILTNVTKTQMKKTKLAKGRFGQVAQVSKWTVSVDQNTFEVGSKLTTTYEGPGGEKTTSPLSSGEYTTETGKQILVDSNGVIRMVYSKNKNTNKMSKNTRTGKSLLEWGRSFFQGDPANPEAMAEATTVDGTTLFFEGDLAVGAAVQIEADGKKIAAPEGDYQCDYNGVTYAITLDADGVVTEMQEVAEMSEEMAQLTKMLEGVFTAQKAQFAEQAKRIKQLEAEVGHLKSGGKFSAAGKKIEGAGAGSNAKSWRDIKS